MVRNLAPAVTGISLVAILSACAQFHSPPKIAALPAPPPVQAQPSQAEIAEMLHLARMHAYAAGFAVGKRDQARRDAEQKHALPIKTACPAIPPAPAAPPDVQSAQARPPAADIYNTKGPATPFALPRTAF